MKRIAASLLMGLSTVSGHAASLGSSIDPDVIPEHKITADGHYLSSHDAFELVKAEPTILFVDVREPVEVAMMGHPKQVDAIIPVMVLELNDTGAHDHNRLVDNPDFLADMEKTLKLSLKSRHDLIILTCGSGRRSAIAAEILSEAGYTNVWHITDGYAGDHKAGFNEDNAWKAAGLPWSSELVQDTEWRLRLPE